MLISQSCSLSTLYRSRFLSIIKSAVLKYIDFCYITSLPCKGGKKAVLKISQYVFAKTKPITKQLTNHIYKAPIEKSQPFSNMRTYVLNLILVIYLTPILFFLFFSVYRRCSLRWGLRSHRLQNLSQV